MCDMNRWPSGRVSAFAFSGCWFDLQWWGSRYALLMRTNKIETAVLYVGVCGFSSHGNSIDIISFLIYIYIFVGAKIEKSNTLKWIGQQGDLFLSYLFLFNKGFWRFTLSSVSKWFIPVFPLIYRVATVSMRLWFSLIPGFVSANFQFGLIVLGNFSSFQVLFFAFSFFSSFSFYKSAFCVFVCLRRCSCPCMCIYFLFILLHFWYI